MGACSVSPGSASSAAGGVVSSGFGLGLRGLKKSIQPTKMAMQMTQNAIWRFSIGYLTGSYPPGCHGPQRQMRAMPADRPRTKPFRRRLSIMYCEQLGVKRQTGGMSSPSVSW